MVWRLLFGTLALQFAVLAGVSFGSEFRDAVLFAWLLLLASMLFGAAAVVRPRARP